MRRTTGDKPGAPTSGFLANLSGGQQAAVKPGLISLAPPPSQVLPDLSATHIPLFLSSGCPALFGHLICFGRMQSHMNAD